MINCPGTLLTTSCKSSAFNKSRRSGSYLIFALLVTLTFQCTTFATAHSWMNNPMTYNRRFRSNCRGAACRLPCPNKLSRGRDNNTQARPAAVLRRGGPLRLSWLRNGHRGGFARFALVPVSAMFDHAAHARLSFLHVCWDGFEQRCRSIPRDFEECGTDDRHFFATDATVPDVYPDGDYVVAQVWYGGLHYQRKTGQFADYWSCAHVTVRGGAPLRTGGSGVEPEWRPGKGKSVRNGRCQAAVDTPRECTENNQCRNRRSSFGLPAPFKGGRKPQAITAAVVSDIARSGRGVSAGRRPNQDDVPALPRGEGTSTPQLSPPVPELPSDDVPTLPPALPPTLL